ncbi:MAG: major facilitator superfamily 1 [Frankiales bacterium]|nr:major facilitator superfamily 1 [Frankiales bacterium]
MPSLETPPIALRRARTAVLVHFFGSGAGFGVWASRLPAIKSHLGLDNAQIGFVVFCGAVGALAFLKMAARIVERFGSRRTTQVAGAFTMVSLLLPASAWNLPTLAGAMFVISAAGSTQDVAMNSQAVAIEHRWTRPIMSSFHACFSIGGMVGAGIGAISAKLDLGYRSTLLVTGIVLLVAVLLVNGWLLEAPETASRKREDVRGSRTLPHRRTLFVLGAIGFASFVAEGSAGDWAAIYLRDDTHASAATAAVGFMVFNILMTVGRLVGDRLAARFGALPLIRLGTGVAGVGMAIGLFIGTTTAGIAGFAAWGIGLSIVVPQVFSAAGLLAPGRAPAALAVVSAISYFGFLLGPATIGAIAQATGGLRTALFVPVVLTLLSSVVAGRLHVAPSLPDALSMSAPGDSQPPLEIRS